MSKVERRQLEPVDSDTARNCASECITQLFELQVERTPAASAICFEEHALTYRQLNERANRLAHYLRERGVGPERLVGLYFQRSVEMVVGLLGILKAGGAYLPLDTNYPSERLRYMIADAGVKVLLAQKALPEPFAASEVEVVRLDHASEALAKQSGENPTSDIHGANLAYVIYTSGSTGRPKGVMIQHQGLCNLASTQARLFHLHPRSRVLQFASISFDASVSEIFKTFAAGGTLILPPPDPVLVGAELSRVLLEDGITVVTLPPSILATLTPQEFPRLETLIVAGEACSAELAARWAKVPHFINAYGPTEATVCATIGERRDDGTGRPPSIGCPIDNSRILVLEGSLAAAGAGTRGELYIGGIGVARGYLERPDLTAERFVPHPYAVTEGERLYRTGDLVRYRENGELEYVGRQDHQVKVRGHRIELGEIEAALSGHELVRENVVVLIEDDGEPRLVAYVVVDAGRQKESISELRECLKQRLPDYMVPATFVNLAALPLTANGKVDRQALPAVARLRPETSIAYAEPRTELETLLAKLWEELLRVEPVGRDDNFFELGGDSIGAALFLNRLQAELNEVIYVVALFDAPSLKELAQYLEEKYPDAIARKYGREYRSEQEHGAHTVDEAKVAHLRSLISGPASANTTKIVAKNPPAVFILSPPRSGSTLLRVMLAGHPDLFAPPELQLLQFDNLAERKQTFSGRYSFWLEGTIRALMEITGGDADEARQTIEDFEQQKLPTQQFYLRLQQWIEGRMLVDKTPSYALHLETLQKAEVYFENARYIHLLRHPNGMIRSFQDAKLDQIFRYEHPFPVRELAELIWIVCHENILRFLTTIPDERRHRVRFEELVSQPRSSMEALCRFLQLDFHEDMLEPHQAKERKMTDGIHGLSRMLGDIKFHEHKTIDARIAERWRAVDGEGETSELTRTIAEALGYQDFSKSEQVLPAPAL
jgi:amino acid adenylation domain-containing protein